MLPLAERVLDAYGGGERWQSARAVHCTVTAWGFAFIMKMRGGVRDLHVQAEFPHARVVSWSDRNPGVQRIFDSTSVRIENSAGETVASRADPRRDFPYGRRLFYWDRLDDVYFSSYAIWNYVTFPALLMRNDIEWTAPAEHTLEARFTSDLPTRNPVQQFHFDPDTNLLRQHDYTAEVFGNWATAANVVLNHAESDGIPYPSHRRITPANRMARPAASPSS